MSEVISLHMSSLCGLQSQDGCTDGIEEVFSFDLEKVAEADQPISQHSPWRPAFEHVP